MIRNFVLIILLNLLICFIANGQVKNETISKQDSIYKAELAAYEKLIDSLLLLEKQEKESSIKKLFVNEEIQLKFFNIPANKLADYNNHEGFRVGFGLSTNENISKVFSLGSYFGYGFHDKEWKYGGNLNFNLHNKTQTKIQIVYLKDVQERAGYQFLKSREFSSESFRRFMIDNMDNVEEKKISFSTILIQNLNSNIYFNQSEINSSEYYFIQNNQDTINDFSFNEIGIKLKYSPFDSNIFKYNMVIYTNFTKGTTWINGEYDYTKIEAKLSNTIKYKSSGVSNITLVGGIAQGNIPLVKLYNGHGSYQSFSIESENSFGTMRMGEFYADRFFNVYFKHEFHNSLISSAIFKPRFALIHNYGIGSLDNKSYHQTTQKINSFDKGYYEAGLLINDILKPSFVGLGFGIFYRYGPYSFTKTADNFAYKLSLSVKL